MMERLLNLYSSTLGIPKNTIKINVLTNFIKLKDWLVDLLGFGILL